MNNKDKNHSVSRTNLKRIAFLACAFAVALATVPVWHEVKATNSKPSAELVRWDIISTLPGLPIKAGGEAFAFAYNTPGNPSAAWIRLTGAGTFVAPASGGGSSAVTGGGTWHTSGPGLPEASGTYRVTKLVNWQFASFNTSPGIDEIADLNTRANGNAVLVIEYDDGSDGILGVGCHGPGSPNGILEGVIASKGYVTYWNGVLPPGPTVDQNRTVFHVLR